MRTTAKCILSLLLLLVFIPSITSAQIWTYARHSGGTGNDYGSRIAIDNEGNTFALGEYTAIAAFDSITIQSKGKWNAILAKYNSVGNIIWAKTVAFSTQQYSDLYANALQIDKAGNIYIGGKFYVDMTVGDIPFSCKGSSDMYLAKFSGNGSLIWAKQIGEIGSGSYGQDEIKAIALDSSGSCYITGTYNCNVAFDSIALSSPNNTEIFIAKYDSSGKALWAASGTEFTINHTATAITVDGHGNSYITGIFYQKLGLGNDILDAVDAEQKIFLAKIDAHGTFIWGRKVGSGGYYGGAKDIKIDNEGNCYLAGFFRAGMHIGTEDLVYNNNLNYAAIILKYDNDGNFTWVRRSTGDNQNASVSGIALDSKNNLFITGSSSGPVSFGQTTLTNQAQGMCFTAELNSEGSFLWAKSLDGFGHINGTGVGLTSSGNCLFSGTFDSVITIGSNTFTTDGGSDVFLAELNLQGNGVEDSDDSRNPAVILYPNPVKDIIHLSNKHASDTLQIISATGKVVHTFCCTEELNIADLPAQVYFLRLDGKLYPFIKE